MAKQLSESREMMRNAQDEPLRVLMVGPDRSLQGGIVTVVEGYFEAGLEEACVVEYLGTGCGTNPVSKAVSFAKALLRYRRIIDQFDIVHLHISIKGSYTRKALMARIAHKRNKLVVLHEHSGEVKKFFEEGSERYRQDVRKTFSLADRVVVLSPEWYDYFAENICDKEKLVIIPNGVRVPDKVCSCDYPNVLFLGCLDTRKSPDVLLRASVNVLTRKPHVRLLFAGDGDVALYEDLARELGIFDKCEFLGWVSGSDLEALFARTGVFCLPSKNEGLPMSLLEAMAYGLPCIATPVGGVPQVIVDGENGFIMPVDDEAKLAQLLEQLIDSQDLKTTVGKAARSTIEERFCQETVLSRTLDMYSDLMSKA